ATESHFNIKVLLILRARHMNRLKVKHTNLPRSVFFSSDLVKRIVYSIVSYMDSKVKIHFNHRNDIFLSIIRTANITTPKITVGTSEKRMNRASNNTLNIMG
ncbi:hypothetical protein ACJX0J_041343, partial [Zea mays]